MILFFILDKIVFRCSKTLFSLLLKSSIIFAPKSDCFYKFVKAQNQELSKKSYNKNLLNL